MATAQVDPMAGRRPERCKRCHAALTVTASYGGICSACTRRDIQYARQILADRLAEREQYWAGYWSALEG